MEPGTQNVWGPSPKYILLCSVPRLTPCCICIIVCMRRIVTWWGGPGGVEAWSLGLLLPSVLWQLPRIGFNPTRSTSPCYNPTRACNIQWYTITCTEMNVSTVKWAQWDKTQSRDLLGLFICVRIAQCTIVVHNIAQNRPDNFLFYPPDNHQMSIWGKGGVLFAGKTIFKIWTFG